MKPAQKGANIKEIFDGIDAGRIKALYSLEDDIISAYPEKRNTISKLKLLIVHSVNSNKTSESADIIFPAASFAEKNGTMVNFQGRIQQIRTAIATTEMDRSSDHLAVSRLDKFGTQFDRWANGHKVEAYSSWRIIQSISNLAGAKTKFGTAEEVFEDISKNIILFSGLNYELIGENGVQLQTGKEELV